MNAQCRVYLIVSVYVLGSALHIFAYSTANGKGIFQTYNAKKSVVAGSKGDSEKFFFGGGSGSVNDHISRAPSHDTPASPCKCSKCNRSNELGTFPIAAMTQ